MLLKSNSSQVGVCWEGKGAGRWYKISKYLTSPKQGVKLVKRPVHRQ